MNFARDILPLLLAGGGMAAAYKSGIFDPNKKLNNDDQLKAGLTQQEIDQNNQVMDRMRRGAPASPMEMGPQMPGASFIPKNPLAGSAPMQQMSPAFANPNMAYQMPQQMQGGQVPSLLAAGAGPQPMMAQDYTYPNSMQALIKGQQPPSMAFSVDQTQPIQWANPANINYGLLGKSRVG